MSKHGARRNWGGLAAGAAGLTALALTGTYMIVGPDADAAPAASCSDSLNAYNTATGKATADQAELAKAKQADADAQDTRNIAITKAQAAYLAWAQEHPDASTEQIQAQQTIRDAAVAKANQDYANGKTADNLATAQATYNSDAQAAADAKDASDEACQGQPGPTGVPGAPGAPGTAGKDGINARIVLSPGVCAQAIVRPETDRLVRVVVLIPCPVPLPPAPASQPKPGDQVVVIPTMPTAPAPQTVTGDLPVTH